MQVKVLRRAKSAKTGPSSAEEKNGSRNGTSNGHDLAEATLAAPEDTGFNVYDQAVKELVALSENDQYAKTIDTGPLSEARGKDTWQLHTQLRMLEEVNKLFQSHAARTQAALRELDAHLRQDAVSLTSLIEGTGAAQRGELSGLEDRIYERLTGDIGSKFEELKDVNARLIDKRFNQTEVAFASVRADVEVVKALLTDIIKSRIGRGERQQS